MSIRVSKTLTPFCLHSVRNEFNPIYVTNSHRSFWSCSMKASPLEFRFRFLILGIIFVLGFIAPWNYALHLDTIRTWQLLAAWVYRAGWMSFSSATIAFLVLGIVLAFVAALLRTWGSAYLGTSVVQVVGCMGSRWWRRGLTGGFAIRFTWVCFCIRWRWLC